MKSGLVQRNSSGVAQTSKFIRALSVRAKAFDFALGLRMMRGAIRWPAVKPSIAGRRSNLPLLLLPGWTLPASIAQTISQPQTADPQATVETAQPDVSVRALQLKLQQEVQELSTLP
jgi:hypothetical protein